MLRYRMFPRGGVNYLGNPRQVHDAAPLRLNEYPAPVVGSSRDLCQVRQFQSAPRAQPPEVTALVVSRRGMCIAGYRRERERGARADVQAGASMLESRERSRSPLVTFRLPWQADQPGSATCTPLISNRVLLASVNCGKGRSPPDTVTRPAVKRVNGLVETSACPSTSKFTPRASSGSPAALPRRCGPPGSNTSIRSHSGLSTASGVQLHQTAGPVGRDVDAAVPSWSPWPGRRSASPSTGRSLRRSWPR